MDSNNGNKISQLTIDSDGISNSDTIRDSEMGLSIEDSFTKKDDALVLEDLLDDNNVSILLHENMDDNKQISDDITSNRNLVVYHHFNFVLDGKDMLPAMIHGKIIKVLKIQKHLRFMLEKTTI